MHRRLTILGAAVLLAITPLAAQGQLLVGPALAWHDDADIGIGASLGFDLPDIASGFGFLGDFIFYFPDGYDYFEFDANLTYAIEMSDTTKVAPFALGGLNLGHASVDAGPLDTSDTEVGLNLGGGVAIKMDKFTLKLGGRFTIGDGTSFALFATIPFEVGGS